MNQYYNFINTTLFKKKLNFSKNNYNKRQKQQKQREIAQNTKN
jgi:hypothetical protein